MDGDNPNKQIVDRGKFKCLGAHGLSAKGVKSEVMLIN